MPPPTPVSIAATVGSLMNDTAQQQYTIAAVLPYINLAMQELQEIYELNDIPTTHATSKPITVPLPPPGTINIEIGYDTTPALPGDLIEIQQLWESTTGLNQWTPMIKKDFIPHYLEDGTTISMFLIWSLIRGNRIELVASNAVNDIKIDGIYSLFNLPITSNTQTFPLPFTNINTYLEYKTAALCAMFIAENQSRAQGLDSLAGTALSRALGIPIKGMQAVVTRRRPFRHSFKHRGVNY